MAAHSHRKGKASAAVIPERRSPIRDRNTLKRLRLCDPGSRFGKAWMTTYEARSAPNVCSPAAFMFAP